MQICITASLQFKESLAAAHFLPFRQKMRRFLYQRKCFLRRKSFSGRDAQKGQNGKNILNINIHGNVMDKSSDYDYNKIQFR